MNLHSSARSTVRSTPGSLVHYRRPTFGAPLWPGIHLDDDHVILGLLRTPRPRIPGCVTPVLLLGEKLELCWALDTEIQEYDPFVPELDKRAIAGNPELFEAYALAESTLGSCLGLEHWKDQIALQAAVMVSDDDDADEAGFDAGGESGDVSDLDEDLRTAILLSRKEYLESNRTSTRLPFFTPKQSFKRPATAIDDGMMRTQDTFREPGLGRSPARFSVSSREQSGDSEERGDDSQNSQSSSKRRKSYTPASGTSSGSTREETNSPECMTAFSFSCDLFRPSAPSAPQSDTIEGDINESGEFVQIYVGPEGKEYTVPKQDIWNRVYFRDPVSGRNYFDVKGEKTWELIHPRLPEIQPDAFDCISEYLTSADGDFGDRAPGDEESATETFSQCLVAWKTADLLGMDDLLDHIVRKIRTIEPWWDIYTIMLFARNIYQTADLLLSAHIDMRDILSTYIAEHHDEYLTGSGRLRDEFLKYLKELPQLKRDILKKELEALDVQENMEIQHEREGNQEEAVFPESQHELNADDSGTTIA